MFKGLKGIKHPNNNNQCFHHLYWFLGRNEIHNEFHGNHFSSIVLPASTQYVCRAKPRYGNISVLFIHINKNNL